MGRNKTLAYAAALVFILCAASTAGSAFIGTGVNLDKHFGNTINLNVGKNVAVGNTAFGLGAMDVGVTWGVDCDLSTLAGYPYGYGGVGAVTSGGLGYNLGLTMDEAHGAGFNGADYGIPLAQQGITTTHLGQLWANQLSLNNANAILPMTGFPAI